MMQSTLITNEFEAYLESLLALLESPNVSKASCVFKIQADLLRLKVYLRNKKNISEKINYAM